jgi:hypothetical protein
MPFSNWGTYTDLLDKLAAAESNWSDTTDFAGFDEQVRKNCSDLADRYGALRAELIESGDYDDRDLLFQHVRIAALARSAETAGMGPDWAGYWISKDLRNQSVYAESRFAAPGGWAAVAAEDGDDGDGDVEQPDLTQQHYDPDTKRWRRLNATDNQFEYYADDGVWERYSNNTWQRFHATVQTWLPYDARSGLWWYADQWRAGDAVGGADKPADKPADQPVEKESDVAEIDFAALAEEAVNETIAELQDDSDPWTPEELAEIIAAVRQNLETAGEQ